MLNRIGYHGPLSVEWEDSGMDREYGAQDALAFVRRTDFAPSDLRSTQPCSAIVSTYTLWSRAYEPLAASFWFRVVLAVASSDEARWRWRFVVASAGLP